MNHFCSSLITYLEPLPILSSSYENILEAKQEYIWQQMQQITVEQAIQIWITHIPNPRTRKSYISSMLSLIDQQIINSRLSLQAFSLLSPEKIIDGIKSLPIFIKKSDDKKQWSMRTREARISCFLAFTGYLDRETSGIVRKAIPRKEGIKTFSPKSRKGKTIAMTREEMLFFLKELEKINKRDALIAKLCLHGGKRISEILSLRTEQINYEAKYILFKQSKSKLSDDFTVMHFAKEEASSLLGEIKKLVGVRKGLVFVTSKGKPIQKTQLDRNFSKAGKRAGVAFRVSPHNLRSTAVTLWKEAGFNDTTIMSVTGHSDISMIRFYDRSDLSNNVTRKSCLL
jgi:integrase/recombinase XerD